MSHKPDPQQLTLEALARQCGQETDRYRHDHDHDPRYCYELFRRAIRDRDDDAFAMIVAQYQGLVTGWVKRSMHSYSDLWSVGLEVQDFVAEAFERFWVAFTPAKLEESHSLPGVLRYLQTCVHAAVTDAWRRVLRRGVGLTPDEPRESPDPAPSPEQVIQTNDFWEIIQSKSNSSREYLVIYASFYLGLSPREIFDAYRGEFRDKGEIYQLKANFLERLGRDEGIKKLADSDD